MLVLSLNLSIQPKIIEQKTDFELCWQQKFLARLGPIPYSKNKWIGFCSMHKIYYLDLLHTGNKIRCPECDKTWLKKFLSYQKNNGFIK